MYTEIKEAEAFNRPYHKRVSDTLGADRFRKVQVDLTDLRRQVELVRNNLQETNIFRLNKTKEGLYESDGTLGTEEKGFYKTYKFEKDKGEVITQFTNSTKLSGNEITQVIDKGYVNQFMSIEGEAVDQFSLDKTEALRMIILDEGMIRYTEGVGKTGYRLVMTAPSGIIKQEKLNENSWGKTVEFGGNVVIGLNTLGDKLYNTGYIEITTEDRANRSFQEDYGVVYKKPIVDYIKDNYVTKTEFDKYKTETDERLLNLQESITALQPE